MTAPDVSDVLDYLGDGSSWSLEQVSSAYAAERAAQASVCNVPGEDATWPGDLAEALARRVAHNLALRSLPLGLQSAMSEMAIATTRVGGTDAEVRRLEGPWRRRVVG